MGNITLNQFQAIANGTHNVGQIRISDDGKSLEKVNNHVYRTSLNNVRLTWQDNYNVRQKLCEALSRKAVGKKDDFEKLLLGGGNATASLSRELVKVLIEFAEGRSSKYENVENVEKFMSRFRNRSSKETSVTTSRMDAALEVYASESDDQRFAYVRDEFNQFNDSRLDAEVASAIYAKFNIVIRDDSRLSQRQRMVLMQKVQAGFTNDVIENARACANTSKSEDAGQKVFYEKLQAIFDLAKVDLAKVKEEVDDTIMADYLARIFPQCHLDKIKSQEKELVSIIKSLDENQNLEPTSEPRKKLEECGLFFTPYNLLFTAYNMPNIDKFISRGKYVFYQSQIANGLKNKNPICRDLYNYMNKVFEDYKAEVIVRGNAVNRIDTLLKTLFPDISEADV